MQSCVSLSLLNWGWLLLQIIDIIRPFLYVNATSKRKAFKQLKSLFTVSFFTTVHFWNTSGRRPLSGQKSRISWCPIMTSFQFASHYVCKVALRLLADFVQNLLHRNHSRGKTKIVKIDSRTSLLMDQSFRKSTCVTSKNYIHEVDGEEGLLPCVPPASWLWHGRGVELEAWGCLAAALSGVTQRKQFSQDSIVIVFATAEFCHILPNLISCKIRREEHSRNELNIWCPCSSSAWYLGKIAKSDIITYYGFHLRTYPTVPNMYI
jgi:hypothetical protein